MSLVSDYYKTLLLATLRGNNGGVFSNAKPILILSMIRFIGMKPSLNNKYDFKDKELTDCYNHEYQTHCPNQKVTPLSLPYFHLNKEPYYHIKWLQSATPPSQAHSPSAKYLREHVAYAYFDDELWKLLQDKETRAELRAALIDHFINND